MNVGTYIQYADIEYFRLDLLLHKVSNVFKGTDFWNIEIDEFNLYNISDLDIS